jgi:hypothetical protein
MTTAVAPGVALSSRMLGGHTGWSSAPETWSTREFTRAPTALGLV